MRPLLARFEFGMKPCLDLAYLSCLIRDPNSFSWFALALIGAFWDFLNSLMALAPRLFLGPVVCLSSDIIMSALRSFCWWAESTIKEL